VLYLLGALGFVMRRFDIPVAPAVVGVILGPVAEDHFRRALQIAQGDYATFVTRPLSGAILALAAIALLAPVIRWWHANRPRPQTETTSSASVT
jgi:putative tricarboxylic transport membrane protein